MPPAFLECGNKKKKQMSQTFNHLQFYTEAHFERVETKILGFGLYYYKMDQFSFQHTNYPIYPMLIYNLS